MAVHDRSRSLSDSVQQPTTASGQCKMASDKILWVDGDPLIHAIGKRCLRLLGHSGEFAGGKKEALESLNSQTYDLLITNLGASTNHGLELVEIARRRFPAMGVAIVTGGGFTEAQYQQKERLGVKHLLAKPFAIKDLKQLISDALQSKK